MKLTVLFYSSIFLVIFVNISEGFVHEARDNKAKKNCFYNGLFYPVGTVEEWPDVCLELACVRNDTFAILVVYETDHECICDLDNISKNKPKGSSCKFNGYRYAAGDVIVSDFEESKCFTLECVSNNNQNKIDVMPVYHSNCHCEEPPYHWSYEGHSGPSTWPDHFSMCGLNSQSPINIISGDAIRPPSSSTNSKKPRKFLLGVFGGIGSTTNAFPEFEFRNYRETPAMITIKNNGHSAQLSFDMLPEAAISGGGLDSKFTFLQLHFHWGSISSQGSEHTVDGMQYPMEMHFVHYNKEKYESISESIKHSDGLAVLGVFFELQASPNPLMASIIDGIHKVHKSGDSAKIQFRFPLYNLLPTNPNSFYRYYGSLTTPTCNEAVIWTVFKDKIMISEEQWYVFRHLMDDNNHHIVDNFRPVQPLNGRTVYVNN